MTTEEFLKSKEPNTFVFPTRWLIEFAKIHVEKALLAASNNCILESYIKPSYKGARYRLLKEGESYDTFENTLMTKVDKTSILNAYNLDDIK